MSYDSAYDTMRRLDRISGILSPSVGAWSAWPPVRMQLLWMLQYRDAAVFRPPPALRHLNRLRAALKPVPQPKISAPVVFLGNAKVYRDPEGRLRETNFDELVEGEGPIKSAVLLHYPWPGAELEPPLLPNALSATRQLLSADLLAVMLHLDPAIRRVAYAMADRIAECTDVFPIAQLRRRCLLALTVFEARRRVFRGLYRKLDARAVVATYVPGRMGEIAAARELGLPVIELQHGMFGRECADYHWPAEYAAQKHRLPLADRIGVYGSFFGDFIKTSGYWRDDQIAVVGCGPIDRFRHRQRASANRSPRLLFMTQITSRNTALRFLQEFIALAVSEGCDLKLDIKIHPEEQGNFEDYRKLEALAAWIRVLPADCSPFEAITQSDLVLAFNSFALIEALSLGIPAVSLQPEAGKGFAEAFGIEDILGGVIPGVADPRELLARTRSLSDPAIADPWRGNAARIGRGFIADGFVGNAAGLINSLLADGEGLQVAPR